ncbi:MAG: cyclic nucleotide-binding domain-containing protein [Thermoplasmata archaeon]
MSARVTADPSPVLEDHPFLRGFDPDFLTAIGHRSECRRYGTGELLVREGDAAREFFLVYSGKVSLEVVAPATPPLSTQTVGPGEVVGWAWLIPPHRWPIDARALKPTRTLVLDADALRRRFESHPEEGYRFLSRLLPVIAQRLDNLRLQLLSLHGV